MAKPSKKQKREQKRGAVRGDLAERITIPIPRSWEAHIETAVKLEDSDRSKLIRNALRFHFASRFGITLPAA